MCRRAAAIEERSVLDAMRLFPEFGTSPGAAEVWEGRGAAPLIMVGPKLIAARRLVATAALMGSAAFRAA
jgi:hypothetical protein